MGEVNVRILHLALDLAQTGGVDETKLLEGLPSVATVDGARPSWFAWSDFVELFERLERALGGPDGFKETARLALPTAYPEFRAFAGVFVSPMALFTFMMLRHQKMSFRVVDVQELERFDDGRIRWRETIQAPYRASEVFHRTTRTMTALMPMHLGLPEAHAEITSMTPRTAELIATFPPPSPLATRGRQAAAAVTSLIAAQLDEAYAAMIDRLREGRPASTGAALNGAAAGWPEKLKLSPRQSDVFALLVQGRANKDIASALACSERNVEFHVGRILRAARVTSRTELLVKVLGKRI